MALKVKLLIQCHHVNNMAEIKIGPYTIEGGDCAECESVIHNAIHHLDNNMTGRTWLIQNNLERKLNASLIFNALQFILILLVGMAISK